MRAIRCHGLGDPEALILEDIPPPPIIADGVRIAARATGVNFADTLMIRGQYQRKPEMPFSPGMETAGVVTEVGADVTRIKPGDRVVAALTSGGFAEEVIIEERFTFAIPDEMDFEDAVNFAVVYPTAHGALSFQGRLEAGETALIHGAAGGVGLAGVEVAKAMGATVIATAGSADKLALSREHGADHGIDTSSEDIRERVLEITGGRGADVVLELIGGEIFDATLRCVAWNARIVTV
ncbi:MAG: NADPH:quinone oxidoreductase family protein, partial [Alphaproteobacteria bacterium]